MGSTAGDDSAAAGSTAAAPPELLAEMRKATRAAHRVTNVFVIPKIMSVLTNRQLYAQALGSFLPVYSAIERLLRQHRDVPCLVPVAKVLLDGGLERAAAIEQDLAVLLGPQWRSHVPPSTAAQRYVQHLDEIAQQPALLVPYAFSCYVTVLVGVVGDQVRKTLSIEGDQGAQFFNIKDRGAKLKSLRAAVNEAGTRMDADTRQQVLQEATQPFTLNNAVVAEFRVGMRAMLHAVHVGLLMLPRWLLLAAAGVGLAGIWAVGSRFMR